MHTKEIRDNCRPCGHHEMRTVVGSIFAVDWCATAGKPCADILECLPDARTPRVTRQVRMRKNPIHLMQPDFRLPDFGPPPKRPKRLS